MDTELCRRLGQSGLLSKKRGSVRRNKDDPGRVDRRLGDELTIDIAHYQQRPDCEALVCFAYDPQHRLKNPRGLENDLSKQHDGLVVKVVIRPQ